MREIINIDSQRDLCVALTNANVRIKELTKEYERLQEYIKKLENEIKGYIGQHDLSDQ